MFSLRPKKTAFLGIDISPSSVKLVELVRDAGGVQLARYAIVMLSPMEAATESQSRIQVMGAAIRKGIRQLGTKVTQAVTAVPISAVITKTVSFPATLNEDEIEAQIELEAERYIPFPLEDVSLDFFVVGPTQGYPQSVDVQVVASRREFVEDRAAALEWAGLKAEAVDVESFALMRGCDWFMRTEPAYASPVYAVCDMGAATNALIVIRDQQVIYNREQAFGGRQLTTDIQQRFGLTFEDAEAAKKTGRLLENYEADILAPFIDTLGQQVHRGLRLFNVSQPQVTVNRIFLSGGNSALPGLDRAVAAATGCPVSRVDPFAGMSVGPSAAKPSFVQDAPSLLIATGLALHGLDA